ncbi:DUF5682 family protein [Reyranella sp. CPCC 100927]|uniref:DUF5682 family protein n=1 Tax=Reyranella sp. CPCC 100927 TaxID=2599616 RepID=UPI0011B7B93F|nr:DUF5682 family protein [Reyranella sp. CPCC 100927]TWT14090.1 hypothetical protein FQU96_09350 [Reyranella sp. CPCC 100927]
MAGTPSIFGVRHHGPGSARRLVEALDRLQPQCVLIEGPSDVSDLIPLLAHPEMVPPVALLTYAADEPARALFFPFAEYSPEYQAALWAVRRRIPVRFIDLPAAERLAPTAAPADTADSPAPDGPADKNRLALDPIGALAAAAGYDDGESWWRDVIEENPEPGPVFDAVAEAMTALRAEAGALDTDEAAREAHMRLELARALKETEGPVAVVCGAWHAPALVEKHALKDDRALLKDRPKVKIKATVAPWTTPRLARASGYGAGVPSPGWCAHLWHSHQRTDGNARWLARTAGLLRARGHLASTASLIEAERLAHTLAALRARPAVGFEELRDAVIACLCHGERLVWDDIARELLVGTGVGAIPRETPLAPLLEDLQRQQKATRLKAEALDRELALDLRTEAGLMRSTLLHRLVALDVPWGRLDDAGRSRGTFRERWVLRWEPEYAVRLVENLVFGATIEQAASGRLRAQMREAVDLSALASLVRQALTARLDEATRDGLGRLDSAAARTSDCLQLLNTLAPLADAVRYGEARTIAADSLFDLLRRLAVQGALALPYAARNLDAAAATALRQAMLAAHQAMALAELTAADRAPWWDALAEIVETASSDRLVAGSAARLLFEGERLSAEDCVRLLGRMLSPGVPIAEAAGFFEGFFTGIGQRLLHDTGLRDAVDAWLRGLEEPDFVAHLPIFRRVFATLDRSERRRLMDALFTDRRAEARSRLAPHAADAWPSHMARLLDLLARGAPR